MERIGREFITLQEAASISGKAEQTMRRAIKARKLPVRKNKTPQGFTYLVDKAVVIKLYRRKDAQTEAKKSVLTSRVSSQPASRPAAPKRMICDLISRKKNNAVKKGGSVEKRDGAVEEYSTIMEFQKLLRGLVEEHQREREHNARFLRELQDKVIFLEHQVMMLQAPEKKWWKFWG